MKHSIIINQRRINVYIGSCPTCEGLKQVKNSVHSTYCLDCANTMIDKEGFNKTIKLDRILLGMTSEEVIQKIKDKKVDKAKMRCGHLIHTTWERI